MIDDVGRPTRTTLRRERRRRGKRRRAAPRTVTVPNRSPVEESAAESCGSKRQNLRRRYKIQDVIQRRQVLLVQVVKEERGNKGAALTTYLASPAAIAC